MNIQEEKQYIYVMLKDITTERRKLVDMYYDLKKRLDFLNSMEEKGIEDLSITGYIDLHNKIQKEATINNIKRENEHQIQKIEKKYIIEESKKNEEKIEESIIPEEIIKEEVHKTKVKRTGQISRERIYSSIINALKDAGIPIKISEILKRVNEDLDVAIKKANMQTNILPDLLKINKKIERPMKGYYQYRI